MAQRAGSLPLVRKTRVSFQLQVSALAQPGFCYVHLENESVEESSVCLCVFPSLKQINKSLLSGEEVAYT